MLFDILASIFHNRLTFFLFAFFFFSGFISISNPTYNTPETYLSRFNRTAIPDSLIIKGILVDKKGNPLKNKTMVVLIPNKKTTVDLHKNKPKKAGLGKQIKGTGTLAINIEGVVGGGAYKLIDGAITNPNSKTDNKGNFIFKASSDFIRGENELLVTVNYNNISVTVSYPLVNKQGNPMILKINYGSNIINLGKVKTLKE